jgi:hypothetical protein
MRSIFEMLKFFGKRLVDRGDPVTFDFGSEAGLGGLVADGAWHDLDLSPIVPAGASHVQLAVTIQATTAIGAPGLWLRKNGNTGGYNVAALRVQTANQSIDGRHLLLCDAGRVIEYFLTDTSWSGVTITVCGWI